MKLLKLIVTNYLGILGSREILFDSFNVIVGKNDVGKSTILKALNLFINEPTISSDDIHTKCKETYISIELVFDCKNRMVKIDDSIETSIEGEELVNSDGLLQIKKVWDISKSKPKPEIYLRRKYYFDHDFVMLPETQLLAVCKKLNIETKKGNGIDFNNVEKRVKIREYLKNELVLFDYREEKLSTTGTSRSKMIFDAVENMLPRFEYFKADASLSESDSSIQNFFKNIAVETIKTFDTEKIETIVKEKVGNVLSAITDKINAVVSTEETVKPEVKFDWSKLVSTTFTSNSEDGEIPLSARGDGFRRITMMAYFEYLAERGNNDSLPIIFGFEEPETFLHPSAQENLFEKLKSLSENKYQVVVCTHSPIIVANTNRQHLIHITKEDNTYNIYQNINNIKQIADDLGIKVDNQFLSLFEKCKAFLFVEGPNDVQAFRHLCNLYKGVGEIQHHFDELGVVILPVGGCDSIKHWVSLDLIKSLNKPFFIYHDSDKDHPEAISKNRESLKRMGFQEDYDFMVSKKRELENYIPATALRRLISDLEIEYDDFDDVKKICKNHPKAGILGGGHVTERYFSRLTYEEVKTSYFDGHRDEFIDLYNAVKSKLRFDNIGELIS